MKKQKKPKVSEQDFKDFSEKVLELVRNLRVGVCPIYQCGGELESLEERINWQEPDLKCKSCGAYWKLEKRPK